MIDAGHEEEAGELRDLRRAAHALLHLLVILDRALRRDELIREPMRDEEFAAAVTETREVGIVGAEHRAIELGGLT